MKANVNNLNIINNDTFSFGKFTVVELTSSDGIKGVGIAKCSKDDRYKRNMGVVIAQGRAEKALYIKTNKTNKKIQHIYMG